MSTPYVKYTFVMALAATLTTVSAAMAQSLTTPLFLSCQIEGEPAARNYKVTADDLLIWDGLIYEPFCQRRVCGTQNDDRALLRYEHKVSDDEIRSFSYNVYYRRNVEHTTDITIHRTDGVIQIKTAEGGPVGAYVIQRGKCVKGAAATKPVRAF